MPDQWGHPTLEEIKERMPSGNNALARWSGMATTPAAQMQRHHAARGQAITRAEAFGPAYVDKTKAVLRTYPGATPEALLTSLRVQDDEILRDIFTLDAEARDKLSAERMASGGSATMNAAAGGDMTSVGRRGPLGAPPAKDNDYMDDFFKIDPERGFFGTLQDRKSGKGFGTWVLPKLFSAMDVWPRAIVGGMRGANGEIEDYVEDRDLSDLGQAALQVVSGTAPAANLFFDSADILEEEVSPWEQTELVQAGYSALGMPMEGEQLPDVTGNPLERVGQFSEAFRDPEAGKFESYFNEQQNSEAMQRAQAAQRRVSPTSGPGLAKRRMDDGSLVDTGIWTPGAFAADVAALDPGTVGYSFLSGAVDAAFLVGADPVGSTLGAGWKAARIGARARMLGDAATITERFNAQQAARGLTDEQVETMKSDVNRLAEGAKVDAETAMDMWVSYQDAADEFSELKRLTDEKIAAQRDNAPEQVSHLYDEQIAAQQKIFDDAEAAVNRYTPQFEAAARAAEAEGFAKAENVVEGDEIPTVGATTAAAPTAREAGEMVGAGTIQMGLKILAQEFDVPGVRIWTPENGVWRGTDGAPMDSADDFWLGVVDGESVLVRVPERTGAAAKAAGETADAAVKVGDNVRFGKGRKQWAVQRIADDGTLWVKSEGGAVKSAAPDKVSRVAPSTPEVGSGQLLDAVESPGVDVWNALLGAMPQRVGERLGRLGATTHKGESRLPTWGEIADEFVGLEKMELLQNWMLRGGQAGLTRWGRGRDVTWLADGFGGTARKISTSEVTSGGVKPPSGVAPASARKEQMEFLLKDMEKVKKAAARRMKRLQAEAKYGQRVARQQADEIGELQTRQGQLIDQMIEALRAGDAARVKALEQSGASDALSQRVKDLLTQRNLDHSADKTNLSMFEAVLDPGQSWVSKGLGVALDRMFGRMMRTELPEAIAKINNPVTILRMFKGRIHEVEVVEALANAKTGDEVRAVMMSNVNKYVDVYRSAAKSRDGYLLKYDSSQGIARKIHDTADYGRKLGEAVSERTPYLDFTDPVKSSMILHRWLRTMGTSTAQADEYVQKFWDAETYGKARAVWDAILKPLEADVIARFGDDVPEGLQESVKAGFRTHMNQWHDMEVDMISRIKNSDSFPHQVAAGGAPQDRVMRMRDAHSEAAILDEGMNLPDVAAAKSASVRFAATIRNHPTLMQGKDFATLVNDYWRTSMLVRPAYILRNIAEASARLFVRGSVNLFTHPLQVLAVALGEARNPALKRLYDWWFESRDVLYMAGPGGDVRRIASGQLTEDDFDNKGRLLNSVMREYSETNIAGWTPRDFRATNLTTRGFRPERVELGHPKYWKAHARELLRMRDDRYLIALAGNYEDFPTLSRMVRDAGPDASSETVWRNWLNTTEEGAEAKARRVASARSDPRETADWDDTEFWIEWLFTSPVSKRVELAKVTGGDPHLIDFIARGSLKDSNGLPLWSMRELWDLRTGKAARRGSGTVGDPRRSRDDAVLADLAAAVDAVGARRAVEVEGLDMVELVKDGSQLSSRQGRVVDWFFSFAGGMERRLTWNIEWRYNFYRRSMDFIEAGTLSKADAVAWLDEIEKTVPLNLREGLNRVDVKRPFASMRRAIHDAPNYDQVRAKVNALPDDHQGTLTMDDVRMISGQHASDLNKEFFYNALSENNLWHALRFAIPFGAPTTDSYKTFSKSVFDVTNLTTRHLNFGRALRTLTTNETGSINEFIAQFEPGDYDQMMEDDPRIRARPFLFRTEEGGPMKFRTPFLGSLMGWAVDQMMEGDQSELQNMEAESYLGGLNLAFQGIKPTPPEMEDRGALFQVASMLPGVGYSFQTAATMVPGVSNYLKTGTSDPAVLLRTWIHPFGVNEPRDAAVNILPSWAKRTFVGGVLGDDKEIRGIQRGVMGWMLGTNLQGVEWSTREGQQRLDHDSNLIARWLAVFDGISDGLGPTGQNWNLPAIDRRQGGNGDVYMQYLVADEWGQIRDAAPNYDAAVSEMLNRYGPNFGALVTTSKTTDVEGAQALTVGGYEALGRNERLEYYRPVMNVLYPGEISWIAYARDKASGRRQDKTPEEFIRDMAATKYSWQTAALQDRANREGWTDMYFEAQKEEMGERIWANNPPLRTITTGGSAKQRIPLLEQLIAEPGMQDLPTAQMAQEVLDMYYYWDQVSEDQEGVPLNSVKAGTQRQAFEQELLGITSASPDGDELRRFFTNVVEPGD